MLAKGLTPILHRAPAFLVLALAIAIAGAGCSAPDPALSDVRNSSARLPAADSISGLLDSPVVFGLPDSGGFLLNDQPIPQAEIPARLATLLAARAAEHRAVLVLDNPKRRPDAQWIARATLSAGGRAFDAQLSGWPAPPPSRP